MISSFNKLEENEGKEEEEEEKKRRGGGEASCKEKPVELLLAPRVAWCDISSNHIK
jgi:hypothetical protein